MRHWHRVPGREGTHKRPAPVPGAGPWLVGAGMRADPWERHKKAVGAGLCC